ncbi:hypothetical protein Ciccas_005681 [Cichlidogyrus casuarinus]|uniref:Uncharacterized protein n=1 Tax=Cichlidogyrus casuarinus TaxID=1844966 RepID=A0ABD2Q7Z1_9PLAT
MAKNGVELKADRVKVEITRENSILNRTKKERDKSTRTSKKMQQKLEAINDALRYSETNHIMLKKEHTALLQKDDKFYIKERQKLLKEVANLTRSVAYQQEMTAFEHSKLIKCMQDEERLLYIISDLRVEIVELSRLSTIKAEEREQKARDCIQAENRYEKMLEEINVKEVAIRDQQKRHSDTLNHLANYSRLYEMIKADRNKCLNSIQLAHQTRAELDEKLRVHENELEILKSILAQRSDSLSKMMKKHVLAIAAKDKVKNDYSKAVAMEAEIREKKEQLHNQMTHFNQLVLRSEETSASLKKQIDKVVQLRNDRAVQLIERNEEICIIKVMNNKSPSIFILSNLNICS